MSDDKNPIEHAVELTVLAPIGLALEAKRLLPTFVERGRQQVNMAKVIGQFAVAHGQTTATQKLTQAQAQAASILAEFGLVGSGEDGAVPDDAPAAPAEPTEPAAPAAPRSSEAAADLPIADYDSLAASQVIPRLAGLSAAELAAVEAYEVGHRGRKTILGKITQLGAE
ncbi:MAG TPA: hypothetical protein VNQ33_01585 [Acidimicrobiales bacterium]|nr:hypothetical protein [Acidimicrobiales bacterium]